MVPFNRNANLLSVAPSCITLINRLRGGGAMLPIDTFLNAFDLFGTAVFAFSGALTAGEKGMDIMGMMIMATITAVGGGTARDILLGSISSEVPVFWIRLPIYLEICVAVALGTFLFWPRLEERFGWKDSALPICISDALGLAAFAVLGTKKAVDLGVAPILWVVSGLMTATFGGITRDVLCLQRPRVMYPDRTMYAAPSVVGSLVYAFLTRIPSIPTQLAASLSFVTTFSSRVWSFNNPLRLPHWKTTSESSPNDEEKTLADEADEADEARTDSRFP